MLLTILFLLLMATPVGAVDLPAYTASPSSRLTITPTRVPTATPTAKPLTIPFVSGRVNCKELIVTSGDGTVAPANVSVKVVSSGPLNEVKGYKIDWGNERIQESVSPTFTTTYDAPGTYEVKGYVQDNMGISYGGDGSCTRVIKVLAAAPLTIQPQTGVADTVWLAVGILVFASYALRRYAFSQGQYAKKS